MGEGRRAELSNERARGREAGLTAAGKLPVHAHAECVETERMTACAPCVTYEFALRAPTARTARALFGRG